MSDLNLGVISTSVVLNIDAVQSNANAAAQSIAEMSQQISVKIGNVNNTIKIMADNTAANLEASRQRMLGGLNTLSNVALGMGTAVSAALGSSVKAAADFDSALHEVSANAGLNAAEFKKMHDGILAIAKDGNVRDTPAQLAKGLYQVVSAGFTGQKALDVLHESAIGAAAGLTDTQTAGSALTTVLNSGIKGIDNERQAMDVLLKIVEQGKMKFPELANNIGKVVPTAASFGISMQDVGAALVAFTRQGQPVARATTDLTNLMSKIAHPSREARSEFKALGIEYGVNALKVKGLTGVMDDVIKRTHGHADVLMKLFPELRAYRGAVEAAQNSGKTWHDILETLAHATDGQGQTMKAATEVNKGAEQQYAKMKQEIATLQTEIGEKLLPTTRQLMGQVRDLVRWFSNLSDGTKSNIVQIGVWGAGLLVTIGTIGKFVGALMQIRSAYLAVAGAAGIAQAAQGGAAVSGAAGAGTGLLARLGAGATGAIGLAARVANPVTLTVAGVLAAQRAGTTTAGDGRPMGSAEQELALARRQVETNSRKARESADENLKAAYQRMADRAKAQIDILEPQVKAAQETLAADKALKAAKDAAARADADYAKAALAHDPFPGSATKKGKKGKKGDDKEEDMGDSIADHIKTATKSSDFKASCAFFVSEVLKQAGAGVKSSNSVKDLWQNILAAGGEVVTGGLKRGDILKFHGKNFGTSKDAEGKGNHTGIYNGDGTFTDSHDFNHRRTTRSLADYMRANPDADVKALRLGDKDDRTANIVEKRNEALSEQADKAKELKEKIAEITDNLYELTHAEDEVKARNFLKEYQGNYKADPKSALSLLIAQMDDLAAARARAREEQRIESDAANADYTTGERKANDDYLGKMVDSNADEDKRNMDWREQQFQAQTERETEAKKESDRLDEVFMERRMRGIDTMSQFELDATLRLLEQLQSQHKQYADKWLQLERQKEDVLGKKKEQVDAPINAARAKMQSFLLTMRQNVENILGGAFEKLFEGDSKHFFSDMLKGFIQMLEQMMAKALALGIVNLLTGGAGGFLGGNGKGNGGFLSVFGFDDATNDTKAARWGFDWASKFTGGAAQFNNAHKPFAAGAGGSGQGGDTHVHVHIGAVHNHTEADMGKMADMLAFKVQSGLAGRFVGTGATR